jgi:hypothetical protein
MPVVINEFEVVEENREAPASSASGDSPPTTKKPEDIELALWKRRVRADRARTW